MPTPLDDPRERLWLPALGRVYDYGLKPLTWAVLRVAVGLALVMAGWNKLASPFAMADMLAGMGFWPGWFWSLVVALTEVLGGLLIAAGLFTRPAALAATVLLLVTLSFHASHPYGPAALTPEGIAFLAGEGSRYLTGFGQSALAADGGAGFLGQVTQKAVYASLFWALSCALFAAFGGGYLSADRYLFRREI